MQAELAVAAAVCWMKVPAQNIDRDESHNIVSAQQLCCVYHPGPQDKVAAEGPAHCCRALMKLTAMCCRTEAHPMLLVMQLFPGKEETYSVPFTRVVYIEADDFREEDPGKKYYGLAPGQAVLLRCAHLLTSSPD